MFKIKTLGVKTAKNPRNSSTPGYDFPALTIEQTPEEGSGKSSSFEFNEQALELLGITPEKEDGVSKYVSFINGADQGEQFSGRLFIAAAGDEVRLSKTGTRFANKVVHSFLNEKFDWIDTSNANQVFELNRIEHEDDFIVVEVLPHVENTEDVQEAVSEDAITL